eukprot:Awhi_evm1s4122
MIDLVASAFASFIAAFCSSLEVAIGLAPMLMVLQFLFSGFLITTSAMPVYWRYTLRYISLFTYSFAALAQNNFLGTKDEVLLHRYELLELSMWENVFVLAGLIVMWRLVAYLSL